MRRALFLDRDGTLMEDVGYCAHPDRVQLFPGVSGALRSLKLDGWLLIVVTNQSGVARGYFTEEEYRLVEQEVDRQLPGLIDRTYVSFDGPESTSGRRKPGVGMLEEAVAEFGIDPAVSFMIGDKSSDVACGRAAGCGTILVLTGEGRQHLDCGADLVVDDLVSAASVLRKLQREEAT